MNRLRRISLFLVFWLLACCLGSCQKAESLSWNESGSVLDMLGLASQSIHSIEILDTANGQMLLA
jgi:hypothetical protein